MIDRLLDLEGPRAVLAWVALVSTAIGVLSVYVQAVVKPPVRTGISLAVRTAFVIVFARIAYRSIDPTPGLGYVGALLYAAPGIALGWGLIDGLVFARRGR